MKSRANAALAVIAALVIAGLLWDGRERGEPEALEGSLAPRSAPPGAVARAPSKPGALPPLVAPGEDSRAAGPRLTEARLRQVLADYEEEAAYPSWSRPHGVGTRYKLKWNAPFEDDVPLEDSESPTGETSYRFSADRAHVDVGEPLTSWIEVWRGAPEQRLAAELSGAFVEATDTGERLVPLVYNDEGRDGDLAAGDLRYTNRFVPSGRPELARLRPVRLAVDLAAGGKRARVERAFTYAPRRVLRVASISDAVSRGSLAARLEVETQEAGLYTFEANLLSADSRRPISYVDVSVKLPRGRSPVELVFFGRAIREQQVDGPYLVTDLRGFLRSEGDGPPLWWTEPKVHRTAAYRQADFSEAVWDSPEKQARLDALGRMLEDAASGKAAEPVPPHIHVDEDGNEHVGSP